MQEYNLAARVQQERLLKELDGTFNISGNLDDVIGGLGAYEAAMEGDYDGAEDFPIFYAHMLMREFQAYFKAMMDGEYDNAKQCRADLHRALVEMVQATLPED